jgi:hypothetical protein
MDRAKINIAVYEAVLGLGKYSHESSNWLFGTSFNALQL